MGSSGSTPTTPPEGRVRLRLSVAGEDHPRACTGRRLIRLGLAERVDLGRPIPRGAILLDPHAPVPLSRSDRPGALAGGLFGVDCSWNRLAHRGGYPAEPRGVPGAQRRRLPYLLAGNAQHYGRLGELNTAEALAAGLYLLGEIDRATGLLEGFPGGASFLRLNEVRLRRYADCAAPEETRRAEAELFGGPTGDHSSG